MKSKGQTLFLIFFIGFGNFTFAIQELVEIQVPFEVRKIKGVILSEGGLWPEKYLGQNGSFTLNGPGNLQKKWPIRLNDRGNSTKSFPGSYRFCLDVPGWSSYFGIIMVSKKAKKKC